MKVSAQNKAQVFSLLNRNKQTIKKFGVNSLGVFGSFVRDESNNDSDIDVLVEFEQGKKTYKNFIGLVFYLEDLLGRRVELVTPESLSPYIAPYITKEVEYVAIAS